MSGYYPEGVTGREYEIAGAQREWSDEREVECYADNCAAQGEEVSLMLDLQSYDAEEWATWTCPTCRAENEYSGEARDYSDIYDEYEPEVD